MGNKKWIWVGTVVISLIIVSITIFSLVVKNNPQEYTASLGNRTYTFTDKLGGYSTRFEEHRMFAEAKSLVKKYVIGQGATLIFSEAGIGEISSLGISIVEGEDENGKIIIGLFADRLLSRTTSSFSSNSVRYTKDALENPTGEGVLLAVANRQYFSESYHFNEFFYEFDAREWRKLAVIHYTKLATEAHERHNPHFK